MGVKGTQMKRRRRAPDSFSLSPWQRWKRRCTKESGARELSEQENRSPRSSCRVEEMHTHAHTKTHTGREYLVKKICLLKLYNVHLHGPGAITRLYVAAFSSTFQYFPYIYNIFSKSSQNSLQPPSPPLLLLKIVPQNCIPLAFRLL